MRREVVGLFCMLVLLRGLVSTHLTDVFNSCTLAACEPEWPRGPTCDLWAAVNIQFTFKRKRQKAASASGIACISKRLTLSTHHFLPPQNNLAAASAGC